MIMIISINMYIYICIYTHYISWYIEREWHTTICNLTRYKEWGEDAGDAAGAGAKVARACGRVAKACYDTVDMIRPPFWINPSWLRRMQNIGAAPAKGWPTHTQTCDVSLNVDAEDTAQCDAMRCDAKQWTTISWRNIDWQTVRCEGTTLMACTTQSYDTTHNHDMTWRDATQHNQSKQHNRLDRQRDHMIACLQHMPWYDNTLRAHHLHDACHCQLILTYTDHTQFPWSHMTTPHIIVSLRIPSAIRRSGCAREQARVWDANASSARGHPERRHAEWTA